MRWNNSDSKYLKIRVTLHESELEFNISPKSTGKYLFDLVCSTIGLRETWYFGLQFYSFFPNGKMRLSHWLKLDKKIISQKPEDVSKPLCFFFHTKFFPEDVEQELIQATTRRLFYLSVKATILNRSESNMNGNCFGDLCPSLDVAILLASLASQAEYGDLCEDELSDTEELTYLPRRILRLIPAQLWTQIQSTQGVTQKFREYYKSHKGMNRDKAELQYLKVAQMHHLFGVDFFPIVCVRMKCPRMLNLTRNFTQNELSIWQNTNKCHTNAWLGVTAAGLQLYGKCQRDPPQFTFPWNLIKNVSYRERKFTIKLTSTWRGTSKPSHSTSTTAATSMPTGLNETCGQAVISLRVSQPSRSPLISVSGQTFVGLTVGSSAGGSGTSAASLPSTPISARLVPSVPPISPNMLDTSVNLSSPRGTSRFDSCDPVQQLGASKGRAKVFELGSRCIPGLSAKSSRYSANELAVIGSSVNCLRVPQAQPLENNIGVSLSSKTSYNPSQSNSATVLISVVEVWLADPNQAKTVMSMCAGNHSLFMRRRQPDSIEVQQMRAQAREERARREVERARLAKARAEKAEALEAKIALEARCAQLEEALRHRQKQKSYTSDNRHLPTKSRLKDIYDADSPHSYTSQRLPNEYNSKVAFSSMKEGNQEDIRIVGVPICKTVDDEDDDRKSGSNVVEDGDKTTSDTRNHGQCEDYFDEYSFFPPAKTSDRNSVNHEKSWNDGVPIDENNLIYVDTVYPNVPVESFSAYPNSSDQRLGMGSASVPVTPHVKRSGITVNRRADHFPQVPLRPSESNSFLTDPNGGRFVAANHSNQKVISYPSYLAANTGSVYPHGWPCEVAMKPLWSGDHCTTYEVPVRSVEESTFREQQPSYTPFLNAPGSLPTLHNDGIFYPISRIKPTHVSHISHSPWTCVGKSTRYHPPAACHMCSQPQPCLHEVPYAAPTNLLKHSPYSAPKHQVPYAPHDQSDFSQYVYPSSSLAAILSPIVTHRWQHPQRQSLRHSDHGRGLRQQQSQPMNARSPDPIHIPLMERSTSHVQLSYPQNNYRLASPVETGLTNTHSTCRPSNLGYSLQYIPRSKNVYPGRCDLSPGFDYSNEAHPNPLLHCHCYPATTINEYFRRAASLGVSSWNVDPLWTTAPSNERLFRADELNDDEALYLHESDAPSSRRNILTNQLQAERAHFALLQTQFSRQLCDTWAYLKATRGQQVDKFADFGTHLVGNNMYNNPPLYGCELRHDPAGASDGASTGGGGGNICNMSASGAYDGHGQFHNTSPEHHLYEACSQLNEDASSERINSCKNQGAHDLQLPTNERVYENKLDRNTKGPGQEWSSSVLLRHPHADPNTQSSRQC